jgi:hypothetical protein
MRFLSALLWSTSASRNLVRRTLLQTSHPQQPPDAYHTHLLPHHSGLRPASSSPARKMSDSDSSSALSTPPDTDDEVFAEDAPTTTEDTKETATPPAASAPRSRKRSPSPPHTEVLADNPDIAVRALQTRPRRQPHALPIAASLTRVATNIRLPRLFADPFTLE